MMTFFNLHYNGGIISISHSPFGDMQQGRKPPSPTKKSSRPGGKSSGYSMIPFFKRTKQVPQVPEVQFVGISMPKSLANSTIVNSGFWIIIPSGKFPLKKRISPFFPGI